MRRNIRLLYLHAFLTDFNPHWPYQIIFFSAITGSYAAAMMVVALETLSAALFDIPTGVMSDRIGRRRTIAIGSFSSAVGLALYAGAHGLPMLCAGAVLNGLSQCLFSGNNNALLFETLQNDKQADRFAHYRAGIGMMYQAGLCLSGFAATPISTLGLRAVFIAAAIPALLSIPVSLMMAEPRVALVQKQKSLALFWQACIAVKRNPRLLQLVAAQAISYGVGEARFKLQAAFIGTVWPVWAVGLYRGMHHSISFCGYILARHLMKRVKPYYIFIFRDVQLFILQMAAVVLDNFISPFLTAANAIMFGPGVVASESLQQHEFTDDQRATMGSLSSSAASIVFTITALIIGAVSDRYGVRVGVGVSVVLSALCLPINIRLFRREA